MRNTVRLAGGTKYERLSATPTPTKTSGAAAFGGDFVRRCVSLTPASARKRIGSLTPRKSFREVKTVFEEGDPDQQEEEEPFMLSGRPVATPPSRKPDPAKCNRKDARVVSELLRDLHSFADRLAESKSSPALGRSPVAAAGGAKPLRTSQSSNIIRTATVPSTTPPPPPPVIGRAQGAAPIAVETTSFTLQDSSAALIQGSLAAPPETTSASATGLGYGSSRAALETTSFTLQGSASAFVQSSSPTAAETAVASSTSLARSSSPSATEPTWTSTDTTYFQGSSQYYQGSSQSTSETYLTSTYTRDLVQGPPSSATETTFTSRTSSTATTAPDQVVPTAVPTSPTRTVMSSQFHSRGDFDAASNDGSSVANSFDDIRGDIVDDLDAIQDHLDDTDLGNLAEVMPERNTGRLFSDVEPGPAEQPSTLTSVPTLPSELIEELGADGGRGYRTLDNQIYGAEEDDASHSGSTLSDVRARGGAPSTWSFQGTQRLSRRDLADAISTVWAKFWSDDMGKISAIVRRRFSKLVPHLRRFLAHVVAFWGGVTYIRRALSAFVRIMNKDERVKELLERLGWASATTLRVFLSLCAMVMQTSIQLYYLFRDRIIPDLRRIIPKCFYKTVVKFLEMAKRSPWALVLGPFSLTFAIDGNKFPNPYLLHEKFGVDENDITFASGPMGAGAGSSYYYTEGYSTQREAETEGYSADQDEEAEAYSTERAGETEMYSVGQAEETEAYTSEQGATAVAPDSATEYTETMSRFQTEPTTYGGARYDGVTAYQQKQYAEAVASHNQGYSENGKENRPLSERTNDYDY